MKREPVMLDIPEECQYVFGMFAAAVLDKPAEFPQAFEILLRYSSDRMLRLLAEKPAADVAYTILCYLPDEVRDDVAAYMAANPDKGDQVLAAVESCQGVLNEAIRAEIDAGNMPVAQLMRA